MSQPATDGTAPASGRPETDFTQEIRFAVVMYGGSSLAIYMNGVAQELLRLVRATAPAAGGRHAYLSSAELDGTERVYRKLGQMLARGEQPLPPGHVEEQGGDAPLQTRFIIDILTGTSAGGINAVFLAKALVNDQSLDELKSLWVTEGDIGVLLNDRKSDEGLGLGGQKPPGSLLNSRRMYLKLLEALRGMDEARPVGAGHESQLVDELDLFVTATDMQGRVLPLRLADGVAHERRHRNVFRFRYHPARVGGVHRNDFGHEYNPFLAFASRCTSAHQAAFEVMRLADIEPALRKFPASAGREEYGVSNGEVSGELRKFYEEYLRAADPERSVPFVERSFSDGGVLDNSPFSFASEALPFRHADAPVDRKLIYIEPSPEHPEQEEESAERPDFFKNVLMALSTLPRYQTIVEDLVRVLERNRLVERVGHILLGLEEDVKWKKLQGEHREPPQLAELLSGDTAALRAWADSKRGDLSWGGYQRLRVAEVTDDLTLLVARTAGFDEDSDEFTAVRYLVTQWRDDYYEGGRGPAGEGPEPEEDARPREPQVKFLLLFDLMWLVRRLRFVLNKINEVSCFDARAWHVLDAAWEGGEPVLWPKGAKPNRQARGEMREALLGIKHEVAEAFTGLRVAREELWAREEGSVFAPYVVALGIRSPDLIALLREPNDRARREHAARMLGKSLDEVLTPEARALLGGMAPGARLRAVVERPGATRMDVVAALTDEVVERLGTAMRAARGKCAAALRPRRPRAGERPGPDYETIFRRVLWYYYRHFSDYDQISHPILHATDVGEELDPVEVFRISPEDATFLIDERSKRYKGKYKLAGTTLGHFGAFFEERFRFNDIMWGRLDAAERVIRALLPNDAHKGMRDELTAEAHRAILIEETMSKELKPADKTELNRLVSGALAQTGGRDGRALAAELAARLRGTRINPALKDFLAAFLTEADPLDKFRDDFVRNYEAERAFTPSNTVVNAGRASRVFGRMVEGIADAHRGGNKVVLWLTRLTRWAWGLAEVAVPNTLPNLFAHHLLRVLYLFEVALIVFGMLLASKEVQRFGLVGLALTAFVHVILLTLSDFIRSGEEVGAGRKQSAAEKRRARKRRLVRRVVAVVVGLGLLLGLTFTFSWWMPKVLDRLIDLLEWLKGRAAE